MSFKYQVLDTLDHDGRRFEPGEFIELEDGQATNLSRIGVVSDTPVEMDDSGLTVSGGSSPRAASGAARKAKDKPATEAGKDQAPENADANEADGGDTGAKE
ncbi:hypothetical protein [Fundidesulfovibrio putealis]|uniref:hypothetical protein n=1 Tax=Fundidesulfovibrio putealis TaxID=270496 RepID=UPI0004256C2E|nr:hypothetical protein [Fundidesulfovibrio putealis]